MENDAATLHCPNELCQAPNPLTNKFCQQCSTPLPKRYLWAVENGKSVGKPGEILADRYLVVSKSVLLDTQTGIAPQAPQLENVQVIRPYLRLIPYRLHIPQIYGVLTESNKKSVREILLLEKPPIYIDGTAKEGQLKPELTSAWKDATSMRQLNWLWQIANLWQPLASEGVASSLLISQLLRVEGPLVRLLELSFDDQQTPTLSQLGEFWQQLLPETQPTIAEFVTQTCNSLIQEEILSSEQLIEVLDQALLEVGRVQTPTVRIVTKTDTGPSRQRNEDACYPPSGSDISKPPHPTALAIVCDGIGGHEGGNVASNLAIESIQQQVKQLTKTPYDHIDPAILIADLERAAAVANDKISQRNDKENRQGRQRMGTTLVMGLATTHEMYIAHVGDSRAYWITRDGCYQVTLDDDVASREVRLGYASYREAVQQSASGSLVQALGMSPSNSLHPTAQRFILDEDSIFLLCSDGLSDFDRVEHYWETEILPILADEVDIADAVNKLVDIANTYNGHDNVTIALVHYQIKYSEPDLSLPADVADFSSTPDVDEPSITTQDIPDTRPNPKTKVVTPPTPVASAKGATIKMPLQLIIVLFLIGVAGLVGYWLMGWRSQPNKTPTQSNPTVSRGSPDTSTPELSSLSDLDTGWMLRSKKNIVLSKSPYPISLNNEAIAPAGSSLLVIEKLPLSLQDFWLRLRVCSIPNSKTAQVSPNTSKSTATGNQPLVKPKEELWLKFSQLKSLNPSISQLNDPNQCQASDISNPPNAETPTTAPKPKPKR